LQRVQAASGDLEQRIAEVQAQEEHLATMQARLDGLAAEAITSAQRLGREVVPGLAAQDAA
jgi:hypothetical protein